MSYEEKGRCAKQSWTQTGHAAFVHQVVNISFGHSPSTETLPFPMNKVRWRPRNQHSCASTHTGLSAAWPRGFVQFHATVPKQSPYGRWSRQPASDRFSRDSGSYWGSFLKHRKSWLHVCIVKPGCRCSVRLGGWVLAPLCALGCWCRYSVPPANLGYLCLCRV